MWSINFLPWHEKKQLLYRRFYCKVVFIMLLLLIVMQSAIYWYFSQLASPEIAIVKKPAQRVQKKCDDGFLKSLTLRAILLSGKNIKIIAQDSEGKITVLDENKLSGSCLTLINVESDKVNFQNSQSGQTEAWELGHEFRSSKLKQ